MLIRGIVELILKLSAWGIYATASSKFNVNLMMENGQYFMIHVDFRPPPNENKVKLNDKIRSDFYWDNDALQSISRLLQKDFQRSLGLRTCFTIITKCHARI